MADLTFQDILSMQHTLQRAMQARYMGGLEGLTPAHGRSSMLWMVEELGEAASIIKKKGDTAIMDSPAVRAAFTEELCDVLMYLGDLMLCYGLTGEDLHSAYCAKFERNMRRDYRQEYGTMIEDT